MLTLPDKQQRDETINTVCDFFENNFGEVPKPLQLLTASPGLFRLQNETIQYFAGHTALSFQLLTAIRYVTASRLAFTACIEFNSMLLSRQGMTQEEIAEMAANPESAPLEDNEIELLCFVNKCLDGEISPGDMESLQAHGWMQSDIVDAVSHSFGMIQFGKMLELFRFS